MSTWNRLVWLYDWIQRVLPVWSLIAVPVMAAAFAVFGYLKGVPFVYLLPLALVVALAFTAIVALALFIIDKSQARPLKLTFDPANPNERFWRDSRQEYDRGADGFAYGWDYFVEIRNVGKTTLQNIAVMYCYDDSHDYRAAEGANAFELDPGQQKSVLLFFRSGDFEDEDGDTSDPVPLRVSVQATAKDTVPSRALKLNFAPSLRGWEDPAGPYTLALR